MTPELVHAIADVAGGIIAAAAAFVFIACVSVVILRNSPKG